MRCEICDRYIEKGKKVKVEGSIIITCDECSSYGEVVGEVKTDKKRKKVKRETEPLREGIEFEIETEDLVENFHKIIREAREKKGMKQRDLASSINEPVSLIHRIESGRLKPSSVIIRKIQSKLGVKLLEKSKDLETQEIKTSLPKELTLGDLVVVRKKGK